MISKEKEKTGTIPFQIGESGKTILLFPIGNRKGALLVIPEGVKVKRRFPSGELGPVMEKEVYKVRLGEEFFATTKDPRDPETEHTTLIKVKFNSNSDEGMTA